MYDSQALPGIGHLDGRANVFKEAGWEDGLTDPVTPGFITEPAVIVPPRMYTIYSCTSHVHDRAMQS